MRKALLLLLLTLSLTLSAQQKPNSGEFSLGMRSSLSFFGDNDAIGYGTGGQFRLRFFEWMNSEWFLDYILTDINQMGYRKDAYIGWSVMFEPAHIPIDKETWNHLLTPFIIAGHCFDYTEVYSYGAPVGQNYASRWSSAVQLGLGLNYRLLNRFDFAFNAHYMLHLGAHIDTEVIGTGDTSYLQVVNNEGQGLEGHLFLVLSMNVKIADLWKSKKD